ncbi:hypothetical protein [Bacillus mycoides]|uniref:hypothetical protein n=1 Tax=Bacillus mycoides TaxID=1405 RepID=UPI003D657F79
MRSVFNSGTNFLIRSVIRKNKNESNVSVICEKDGYLSHGGFNIYIVCSNGKTWVDSCKGEKTANKKVGKVNEYIQEIVFV